MYHGFEQDLEKYLFESDNYSWIDNLRAKETVQNEVIAKLKKYKTKPKEFNGETLKGNERKIAFIELWINGEINPLKKEEKINSTWKVITKKIPSLGSNKSK